jgi:hypothetical protein
MYLYTAKFASCGILADAFGLSVKIHVALI